MHDERQTTWSRRDFCRSAVGRRRSLGLSAIDSSSVRAAAPPGRYVNMHTHLGQTWNTTQPLSADALFGWMDANEVAQAVVLPLVSPESSSYPLTTDFVLAETRPHRDRLIPFCSVDPRTSYNGGLAGLVEMLKKYVDQRGEVSASTSRESRSTIRAT